MHIQPSEGLLSLSCLQLHEWLLFCEEVGLSSVSEPQQQLLMASQFENAHARPRLGEIDGQRRKDGNADGHAVSERAADRGRVRCVCVLFIVCGVTIVQLYVSSGAWLWCAVGRFIHFSSVAPLSSGRD